MRNNQNIGAMKDIENVAFVLKSLLEQVQRVKIWYTDEDCGCDLLIQSDASIKIDTIAMDSISNFLDICYPQNQLSASYYFGNYILFHQLVLYLIFFPLIPHRQIALLDK